MALAVLCLGLTAACKRVNFGPDEGISYRDPNNAPTADPDPTDWTSDGKWKKAERDLFKSLDLDLNGPQTPALVRQVGAYPNPIMPGGRLAFYLQTTTLPANAKLQLVMVDKKYRVRNGPADAPLTSTGADLRLDLPRDKFEPDNLYRIYYVLYTTDKQLLYKGHGDILVKNQ